MGMVTNDFQRKVLRERVVKNGGNFKDYKLHKIVLIGDCGAGKTSLLLKFSDEIFEQDYNCTIGLDFKIQNLKVDNVNIKL